jgi:hypothetical protein
MYLQASAVYTTTGLAMYGSLASAAVHDQSPRRSSYFRGRDRPDFAHANLHDHPSNPVRVKVPPGDRPRSLSMISNSFRPSDRK